MTDFHMSYRDCAERKQNRVRGWILSALHGENPDVNAVVIILGACFLTFGGMIAAMLLRASM